MIAFPRIVDLGQKHLRKLRRDKAGAAFAIDQRIQELCEIVGGSFPAMLSLEDQGRFALGYHHQRAHSMAQAKANKEAKKVAATEEEIKNQEGQEITR
jgi:CRISPR-associated protein Csd1